MNISTYGTLKTAVANWSERSDLTGLIPYFVDFAQQEIGRLLRSDTNTITADLTITGETVAVPAAFRAMRRLYLNTSPLRIVDQVSPAALADLKASTTSTGYPTSFAIEGTNFHFGPGSTAATGKALYWGTPTEMTADANTNAVLTKYPFVYLYGSLAELFRYIEDADREAKYQNMFEGLISSINAREASDAMAGGIRGAASAAVV